jgi:hypothetical protein
MISWEMRRRARSIAEASNTGAVADVEEDVEAFGFTKFLRDLTGSH